MDVICELSAVVTSVCEILNIGVICYVMLLIAVSFTQV